MSHSPPNDLDPKEILPHGKEFLFVDEVLATDLERKFIKATRLIPLQEPWTEAHFPRNPIVPGVLIIEGLTQTCGILARILYKSRSDEEDSSGQGMLAGLTAVKFREPVIPGSRIMYEAKLTLKVGSLLRFETTALVADTIVAEAVVCLSI